MAKKIPSKIRLVMSPDEYGCVPACLAMVTGQKYEDVSADFDQDFNKDATSSDVMAQWLGDQGFGVIQKAIVMYIGKDLGRDELLKPFAPAHILIVKHYVDSKFTHAIVMDKDGTLYCPGGDSDKEIRQSYMILETYGIF